MYYFYLLQSINKPNEIYTGSTTNLRLRLNEHNQGKVFSTKRYYPWRLVYYEAYLSEKDARLREQKFKRHGKGNQELKKRLENSLHFAKKGEEEGLPLTISPKKGDGFTLVEMLVATAIFSVALLIATSVFMVATVAQRRTAASQRLQSDVRYAIEAIVRDVKYGTLDYDFYRSGTCFLTTGKCNNNPNLDCADDSACVVTVTASGVGVLGLRDVDGNRTRYRVDSAKQKLMVCKISIVKDPLTYCDSMTTNWSAVTPDGVQMVSGQFYVYPYDDPFVQSNGIYASNEQPRVTVVLKTQQQGTTSGIQQGITAQTTVVSRLYLR